MIAAGGPRVCAKANIRWLGAAFPNGGHKIAPRDERGRFCADRRKTISGERGFGGYPIPLGATK